MGPALAEPAAFDPAVDPAVVEIVEDAIVEGPADSDLLVVNVVAQSSVSPAVRMFLVTAEDHGSSGEIDVLLFDVLLVDQGDGWVVASMEPT